MRILHDIISFILNTTANIYVFLLITRTILLWRHAERINPLIQFTTKATNPAVKPLKKIFPDYEGIEIASIILIISIEFIKFAILRLFDFSVPQPVGLLIVTIAEILRLTLTVFFYAVFLQTISSLIGSRHNSTYNILNDITWPTINFFRRFTPCYKRIDLAPLITLISLHLILIFIINPLFLLGLKLHF